MGELLALHCRSFDVRWRWSAEPSDRHHPAQGHL